MEPDEKFQGVGLLRGFQFRFERQHLINALKILACAKTKQAVLGKLLKGHSLKPFHLNAETKKSSCKPGIRPGSDDKVLVWIVQARLRPATCEQWRQWPSWGACVFPKLRTECSSWDHGAQRPS